MTNEFIFLGQTVFISLCSLVALRLGAYALVTFVCMCGVLANLFVLKQISLFGLNATAADAYSIGATLGLNLLQEYIGKPIARKTIWINFFCLVFYAVMTQFHLAFFPDVSDLMHGHYQVLFAVMPRIIIASFTAYLTSQTVDYLIYGYLRTWWHKRYIVLRNYSSLCISQLVDTILFTFLGLYGLVDNMWNIILISYCIKIAAIALSAPFMALSKKIYSKAN